ncbi:hypothetical protein FEM03_22845 [Phragmitibacter flavus]|uniref:Uncharacterized protein n=1 Tax=Phragmitibacter flavus TaxID=2576071 RepID=A0A5R8K7W5_9BACT|nr:hypothetical protein [Phragmitibacter flavus]TLD68444.1 hypothetical protein FEM03_22845 [Phragmitibacter flavus]
MSTAITPSLRASLERIKHAGAVNGICLAWRRQILVSLMPYEDFRVEQLVQTISDAREHFQSGGERHVDSLWMGFADVNAITVFAGEITVIMLHARADESDFLNGIIKTFLADAQLTIAAALTPDDSHDQGQSYERHESPGQESTHSDEDLEWQPEAPDLDPNKTNVVS